MSVRFYVLPLEITARGQRHPKYIPINMPGYLVYPGIASLRPNAGISLQDYGLEPVCFMAYNSSTEAQHATLAAQADVSQFPAVLDDQLSGARTTVTNRMEAFNIPGDWLKASTSYRELARSILGIFHLGQTFNRLGADRLFPVGVTLATQYGNLEPNYRSALDASLTERGFNLSLLNTTTSMRALFRMIGEQQAPEIFFGVLI